MHAGLTALVVLLALAASVGLGLGISVLVLRWARVPEVIMPEFERDASGRLIPILGTPPKHSRPLLRGGLWVGILERLAITGAIIAQAPELIAVVVAVKGLGRYPDCSRPGRERAVHHRHPGLLHRRRGGRAGRQRRAAAAPVNPPSPRLPSRLGLAAGG